MERSADWMDQARGDLQHARSDVQGAFYDWACFSAPQAAEKAVKALFQRMGAVVWGHSVPICWRNWHSGRTFQKPYGMQRWSSTRPTSSAAILTRIRLALHDVDISGQKRKGWSSMPPRSSGSVKVFYPPWNRETLLARLRAGVLTLRVVLPLVRVVLFGSYARDRQTVASDIDVLVVYAGAARADAYGLVRRTLDLQRLEPHVYADEEYALARDTLERMIQDGITVYCAGVAEDCAPAQLD